MITQFFLSLTDMEHFFKLGTFEFHKYFPMK